MTAVKLIFFKSNTVKGKAVRQYTAEKFDEVAILFPDSQLVLYPDPKELFGLRTELWEEFESKHEDFNYVFWNLHDDWWFLVAQYLKVQYMGILVLVWRALCYLQTKRYPIPFSWLILSQRYVFFWTETMSLITLGEVQPYVTAGELYHTLRRKRLEVV